MMKPRILVILFSLLAMACTKSNDNAEIDLNIDYEVNGRPLVTDTLCFTNEAGNTFLVTEVQWFLSNIELKDEAGDWTLLHQRGLPDTSEISHIFYIDTNIPESQTLHSHPVKAGRYTAIRFTFGLDESDNYTGLFNDPPESEMFWPDMLGGGYHYMKLNGKYLDAEGRLAPLAIHLGIGQNEDCTEFYQNYFIVELPFDFIAMANAENQIDLTMVIDNWFHNPHTFDFNEFGSHIMQNQTAQRWLNSNGMDVFKIGKPTENETNIDMKKNNRIAEKIKNMMQKAAPKPHFWSWESVKERIEDSKFKDSRFKI
jgi:hypothetical protein